MADQSDNEYRPPIMKRIGGVLLLTIGAAVFLFTLVFAAKDIPLWVFGKHTQAKVIETWVERTDNLGDREGGELKFRYLVRYRFTPPKGQVITSTSKASATEWSGMGEGQNVEIVYFPLYPNLNRLDDYADRLPALCYVVYGEGFPVFLLDYCTDFFGHARHIRIGRIIGAGDKI